MQNKVKERGRIIQNEIKQKLEKIKDKINNILCYTRSVRINELKGHGAD